jgi:hypothetical protein
MGLLRQKEEEKDRMDEEADLEIGFHLKQVDKYKKSAEESAKKEKEATELFEITKAELTRQIEFIFKERKRYEHKDVEITELKREIKKKEGEKAKLKKVIEDLEKKQQKSLGKKVEAMVAKAEREKMEKDLQEREAALEKRTKEIEACLGAKIILPIEVKAVKEDKSEEGGIRLEEGGIRLEEGGIRLEERPAGKEGVKVLEIEE